MFYDDLYTHGFKYKYFSETNSPLNCVSKNGDVDIMYKNGISNSNSKYFSDKD